MSILCGMDENMVAEYRMNDGTLEEHSPETRMYYNEVAIWYLVDGGRSNTAKNNVKNYKTQPEQCKASGRHKQTQI